ncbi:tyrosinase family protein [Marinicellulosiphila megalodicopiae]|uniref:tyrosinase family protein n=1 Tax=Marinicellulosiphila megalodicopiae TaxID=2724896 RepID=UPI003BB0AD7C
MTDTLNPTWNDSILILFTKPYWVKDPSEVAQQWQGCMSGYFIDLTDYESVKQWQVTIYNHLRSKSMPLTDDPSQYWPDDALELFRTWVNQGSRQTDQDPILNLHIIDSPQNPSVNLRIRKNIAFMSSEELNQYRAAIEDYDATSLDIENSLWQKMADIHTNWCLHYQEAFLLWHRAYMMYFEEKIGMAVPYWNWMSPNATKDGDPEAGLPQAFIDETYEHPITKEIRPNPLRYAIARNAKSKACINDVTLPDGQCRYVQRDPILYTKGKDSQKERQAKLNLLGKFQQQVSQALQWDVFSTPQGSPGYPWANIPSFEPPPPDSDYPHKCDFDGRYEQPHDNFHGWIGFDMADNTYTAYDPIFWSLHSNIDRIYEVWLRQNPQAQYTATFPIRPFIGSDAKSVRFDDDRLFVYTTIGDMAKDSRSLGYDFEPPKFPDSKGTDYEPWEDYLYIIFDGIRCTHDTYFIDAFINLENPTPEDKHNENAIHYVGRLSRIGMGIEDDKNRCIKHGVTRILDASYNAFYGKLTAPNSVSVSLLVSDSKHNIVPKSEYETLPGFNAFSVWTKGPEKKKEEKPSDGCNHCK